jgi:hypothetical protein
MTMSRRTAAGLTLLLAVAGALAAFVGLMGLASASATADCGGLAPRLCDGWESLSIVPGVGWVIGLLVAVWGLERRGRGPGPYVVAGWLITGVAVLATYLLVRPG